MSNYLYKYYRKCTKSFIANLEQAKSTGNIKDIHKVRTDIKKIRAFIELVKILSPANFNIKEFYSVFIDVFNKTGKIRQLQLHINILDKYHLNPALVRDYKKYINEEKEKLLDEFRKIKDILNAEKFNLNTEKIETYMHDIKKKTIIAKSINFINSQFKTIKKLELKTNDLEKYHDIRIHLKKAGTIAELTYKINESKKFKKLYKKISKTEIELGKWHDKVLLNNSINLFLKRKS